MSSFGGQNFVNSLLLWTSRIIGCSIQKILHDVVIGSLESEIVVCVACAVSSMGRHFIRETSGHLRDILVGGVAGRIAAVHGSLGLIDLLLGRWEIQLGRQQGFLSLLIGPCHGTSG